MTKIDDILGAHKKIVEEMTAKKKELAEQGKLALNTAFKDFFEAVPEVKAVKWSQYTPYFSDGDENIFGVNEYSLILAVDEDSEEDIDSWSFKDYYKAKYQQQLGQEVYNKIVNMLPVMDSIFSLPSDIFKDIFGDHVEVIATVNGFDTNECDHD